MAAARWKCRGRLECKVNVEVYVAPRILSLACENNRNFSFVCHWVMLRVSLT